jgi:predicted RNA-binding Zn-ribbon protein involved in translation (DUF1610 family)
MAESEEVRAGEETGAADGVQTGKSESLAEVAASPGSDSVATEAIAEIRPSDDYDPMKWKLPLICKDCNKRFEVPYRHFQAGVVFHCPHCHGSFVPKAPMCRVVRDAFEEFFAKRRAAREELARLGGDDAGWLERQRRDHETFEKELEKIALEMRPAGKMMRKGWLAGMFT